MVGERIYLSSGVSDVVPTEKGNVPYCTSLGINVGFFLLFFLKNKHPNKNK